MKPKYIKTRERGWCWVWEHNHYKHCIGRGMLPETYPQTVRIMF